MSSLSSNCCCVTPGCNDCFFGLDADTLCCRLGDQDILMLKVPRPEHTSLVEVKVDGGGGSTCACEGEILYGSQIYAEAVDRMTMYTPWVNPESAESNRPQWWFYDDGGFGVPSPGSERRQYLWPPCFSDCCDDATLLAQCACQSGWRGPIADMGCECSSCGTGSSPDLRLSKLQRELIENGSYTGAAASHGCSGTTAPWTAVCSTGDKHKWLNGIADDSHGDVFRHFYWDSGTDSVQETDGFYLAQTIVGVFHGEKWFNACYKYPGPNESGGSPDGNLGSAWYCLAPEWWIYGCSGIPVFSWEVYLMGPAGNGVLSSLEVDLFFQSVYEGLPIGTTETGVSLLEKLEKYTFNHSSSADGVGVLQTKDWTGYTMNNGSDVLSSERRIIRKDLSTWPTGSGGSEVIEYDKFYYGRPGGWSSICRWPVASSTADCGTAMTKTQVQQAAPQVGRGYGCDPDSPCNPAGEASRCFTAAPVPATGVCHPSNVCGGCNVCTAGSCVPPGCGFLGPVAGCDPDGTQYGMCNSTSFNASCGGIHFHFTGYEAKHHDVAGPPFICDTSNHGWLWVLNRSCDESDSSEPKECFSPNCPPDVYDNLGDVRSLSPPAMGNNIRCSEGGQTNSDYCLGAYSTVSTNDTLCQTTSPAGRHPSVHYRDPGTPQIGPLWTSGGCGQYLCNEKRPLGACCKTDTSTGSPVKTCLNAVTQKQCADCAEDANVTTEWLGTNTCCGDYPSCT